MTSETYENGSRNKKECFSSYHQLLVHIPSQIYGEKTNARPFHWSHGGPLSWILHVHWQCRPCYIAMTARYLGEEADARKDSEMWLALTPERIAVHTNLWARARSKRETSGTCGIFGEGMGRFPHNKRCGCWSSLARGMPRDPRLHSWNGNRPRAPSICHLAAM